MGRRLEACSFDAKTARHDVTKTSFSQKFPTKFDVAVLTRLEAIGEKREGQILPAHRAAGYRIVSYYCNG